MAKPIQFTKNDIIHAILGVIPAFLLVCFGYITPGIAFAIGLLPTSLMGIGPTRKLRIIYSILGCLFGIGIYLGSLLINSHEIWIAAIIYFITCFTAALISVRRPAGGLLLSLIIPSVAVGTGYALSKAGPLAIAFIAGSIWSGLTSLFWHEFPPSPKTKESLLALQPKNVKTYGLLLGLTGLSSILIGQVFDPAHPGWAATAAMLIMRPIQEMAGKRGIGRAASTIAGTILVVIALFLQLNYLATAIMVAGVTIFTIGARSSKWYITSFCTAFLILTIEMYDSTDTTKIHTVAWYRIVDNVIGAGLAILFGLIIPEILIRITHKEYHE